MPDWLWERIEPLLPERPSHPLGCHNPRVPDRNAMDAILLVLRTGMQWNALDLTGPCSSSSAHRRFQEWERAGVFSEIWRQGLLEYDQVVGIDWAWLAADGALSKAPLGGPKTGPNPTDRAKKGRNDRSSPRAQGCRSGSTTRAPTTTITSCEPTLDSLPIKRPEPTPGAPQGICLSSFAEKEPMCGDLHHLFACESGCNSFRGNTPYFEFPDFEEALRHDCGRREDARFEPSHGKGAVARATLYFLIRYPGLIGDQARELQPDRLPILLEWHRQEPADEWERHRNAAIAELQGNRNPLIDHPQWAQTVPFQTAFGP